MLYGFSLGHVLEMDRTCIDISGGGLRIRLNDYWVTVDEPVAKLLCGAVA